MYCNGYGGWQSNHVIQTIEEHLFFNGQLNSILEQLG